MVARNESKQILSRLFLVHVQWQILWKARTLFIFWQRAFNTQARPSRKYPSIIVRQTEITLRVVVLGKGKVRLHWLSLGFRYLFCAFHGSVCKYSLNSVIAFFYWDKEEEEVESLAVIALYNYGITFPSW